MRISFASENRYAIKIFAGNVNAISGEPRVPDAASSHRRPGLPSRKKSIQDYVVTPSQTRIDGVVTESREVRQFVAVGSDHSVEAQMTGGRRTACLQFEVTRLESHEVEEQSINITVNTFGFKDKPIDMNISNHAFIKDIQQKIQDIEGHPADRQRLIYRGMGLEDGLVLSDYGIKEGSILHLAFKLPCAHQLRGLKCPCLPSKCQTAPKVETGQHEMAFPLGGVIRQSIVEIPKRLFQESTAISFNVQILYEEPSRVSGGFPGFQSVAQIDGTPEKTLKNLSIIDVETSEPVVDYNGGKGELGNVSGHGRV
ncbi:hypothetical protein H9Q72_010297 [Fusarium xylarioides]|uniref:Ubiquitin-like domain-containing protein n=1 Tax=Fusarium xylarioides TaxID=221167 RepID=A0A9P7HKQ1_9HYPO|nr:hypothetical protein H9Q72_010297 [Fusarium xylarioides]